MELLDYEKIVIHDILGAEHPTLVGVEGGVDT